MGFLQDRSWSGSQTLKWTLNPFRHIGRSKCILEVCSVEFLWDLQVACVAGSSSCCHQLSLGAFTERERIRERKGWCCLDVFLLLSDVTVKLISLEAHQIFTLSCLRILEAYLNPQVFLSTCSNKESLPWKSHSCWNEDKILWGCAFFPYLEILSVFPRVHVPFYLPNSLPYTLSLANMWHGISFCKEEGNNSICL